MPTVRPYQNDCVDSIFRSIEQGHKAVLAVLATGLGKTCIASEIIRRVQPERCAFLAHRDTLVFQARDTIERFAGVKCGIEMAESRADRSVFSKEQVIVGTVQTQNAGNRMADFDPQRFRYLFCDEAHHWVAPSFMKVVTHFQQNPRLIVVGFTATPDRADEMALGKVFTNTPFEYDILEGTAEGWLVPIEQHMVRVEGLDYSHINTTAGDLNLGQLSDVMEAEETIHRMMQPTLEAAFSLAPHRLDYADVHDWGEVLGRHGRPLRTLVFCTSVAQAQRFAEVMNRVRSGMATAVWDKVPKPERHQILKDFASGALQVLVNVGICGEGFDNPGVELVVMGRATKSRSLYTQFVGRCLRPLSGLVDNCDCTEARIRAIAMSAKPCARIMDFVGNSGRHKLITTADILGGHMGEKAIELAKKKAMKADKPMRMSELLEVSEEEIRKRMERARRDAEARRVRMVARAQFTTRLVDPFDALDLAPEAPRRNDMVKKLSPGQKSLMMKFGVNPDQYPPHQQKQLFLEVVKRMRDRMATVGQLACLKSFGVDAKNMKQAEAKKLIDEFKRNGGHRHQLEVDY